MLCYVIGSQQLTAPSSAAPQLPCRPPWGLWIGPRTDVDPPLAAGISVECKVWVGHCRQVVCVLCVRERRSSRKTRWSRFCVKRKSFMLRVSRSLLRWSTASRYILYITGDWLICWIDACATHLLHRITGLEIDLTTDSYLTAFLQ